MFDQLFALLRDGKWHSFYDIDTSVDTLTRNIVRMLRFLQQYDLVEIVEEEGFISSVRLREPLRKFLEEVK